MKKEENKAKKYKNKQKQSCQKFQTKIDFLPVLNSIVQCHDLIRFVCPGTRLDVLILVKGAQLRGRLGNTFGVY